MASYDPPYLKSRDWPPDWVMDWNGERKYIALPHQCGNWKIGGLDDVRALIEDLQKLLDDG